MLIAANPNSNNILFFTTNGTFLLSKKEISIGMYSSRIKCSSFRLYKDFLLYKLKELAPKQIISGATNFGDIFYIVTNFGNLMRYTCDRNCMEVTIKKFIADIATNGYGEILVKNYDDELYSINHDTLNLIKIPISKRVDKVAMGKDFFLALTKSKEVYTSDFNTPILIKFPNNVKIVDIAAGAQHSLFLTANGSVYSSGNNKYGQLGLGDKKIRSQPTIIPTLAKITNVFAGKYSSYFLTNARRLFSCGKDRHFRPTGNKKIILLSRNKIRYIITPTLIPKLASVYHVATTENILWVVLDNGEILCSEVSFNGDYVAGKIFTEIRFTQMPKKTTNMQKELLKAVEMC